MIKNANSLVILSHIYAPGPPHALWDFLCQNQQLTIEFIGHPLESHRAGESFYKLSQSGQVSSKTLQRPAKSMPLAYAMDIWLNWLWLWRGPKRDLVIALDSLNAFSAIWLKRFRRVETVVFYTIDYVPQRFSQSWLNRLYHWLDFFACQHADFVWNLSDKMTEARLARGLASKFKAKQLVVPIGTELGSHDHDVKHQPDLVVFMGHLRTGQGVDRLIQAWPEINQMIPKARLRLIGGGSLLTEYQSMVKKLGLSDRIEFTGFVPTNQEMRRLLAEGSISVAPYVDDPENYTRYTDPGKPKEYLAAGLPVVITKVPAIAETIQEQHLGLAIEDNLHALAKAIAKLLSDPELDSYRARAIAFAQTQTWQLIFSAAFKEMQIKLGPPDA
ncbi:MAG: glycosyltransferase [Candidatus Berkelbacteria bacterium Gr01-1014_85]|uniref:Glycosyltransferase n=1 Tax=Candidatus Berkelbacteria bacterium Gr01-1014_85 TaxID=2017150 RepID=A0A554JB82_9BACT|nr:MAG: glycosyltransferase [Candidatus Berkelbacteria bacterium Gr01-1014_85]